MEPFAPTIPEPLVGLWDEMRVPPIEFRVFRAGPNVTEKGTFVFDERAAELVMADWADRGIDLTIDYEHQALSDPPVAAPAAASRWVPQIRNGELWATEVKWTDQARAYLVNGEYRYFSPAFKAEEDTGLITKILNLALTNVPAMWELMPLVAASRRETGMDPKEAAKKIEELTAQVAQLQQQLSAKDATITDLTTKLSAATPPAAEAKENEEATATLTQALSLTAGARPKERAAAVVALAAFRTNVQRLTEADSDASAIGIIHAWKANSTQVQALSARLAEIEGKALDKEFEAVLDEFGKTGKVAPTEREALKTEILSCTGGKVTADAVKIARVTLSRRPASVTPGGHTPPATPEGGGLDPIQAHIRGIFGTSPEPKAAGQGK